MKIYILISIILLISACAETSVRQNLIDGEYLVIPAWALLADPQRFSGKKIAVSGFAKEASYQGFLMIYPTKGLAEADDIYSGITLFPRSSYRSIPNFIDDCRNKMVRVLGIFNYQPSIMNGEAIFWHPEIYEIPYISELGSYEENGSLTLCFKDEIET